MEKLSVIILFCDKDYTMISNLVTQINEKVKINHEIILVDNRDTYKDELIDTGNARVVSKGRNLYQVQGRKYGLTFATGDYVWFVDGDDSVLEVPDYLGYLTDDDVYIFNFKKENGNWCKWIKESKQIIDFRNSTFINENGFMLWNKWIKKTILDKVEDYISENVDAIASKDTMLTLGSYKFAENICLLPSIMYEYNIETSYVDENCILDINTFNHIIFGHDKTASIIERMLTDEEKTDMGLDELNQTDCSFFLLKIANSNVTIQKDEMAILRTYFDDDLIISTWTENTINFIESKEIYMRMKTLLQENYPDRNDIVSYNEITIVTGDDKNGGFIKSSTTKEVIPDWLK